MINILELVYGDGLTPNSSPIHVYDPDRDQYEHAEFEKDNGDFYQIVKVSEQLTLYHFQKQDADIEVERLTGNWWLRHDEFTKRYENRGDIFYEKIKDRLQHEYRVKKMVLKHNFPAVIPNKHLDREKILEVFYS